MEEGEGVFGKLDKDMSDLKESCFLTLMHLWALGDITLLFTELKVVT